jgi:hypothetical protein
MKALFVGMFGGFASEPGRARIPGCFYPRQGTGGTTSKVGFVFAIAEFLLASQNPVYATVMGAGEPDRIAIYGTPLLALGAKPDWIAIYGAPLLA